MKLSKRSFNVIFALILMLSLFGCDKKSQNQDTAQSESTDSSASENEKKDSTDANEYIFPQSDTVLLTEKELSEIPVKTLELGRNEIFARHGYVFKTKELKEYFSQKSWYEENSSFNAENDLTGTESKNIKLLKSVEDKKINKTVSKKVEGKIYGRIKQVTEENGTKYISFDKVEWLTFDDIQKRQDVKDYMVKEYGSVPSEIENDYFVYDPDTNITKLQFANNGNIINWKFDDTGITTFLIYFEDLKNNKTQNDMSPQDGVYCITVENNIITKLEKMYQP